MKPFSHDDSLLLKSLQDAVREALERKRRLDQYAVVWRDGRPAFIGPNQPAMSAEYCAEPSRLAGRVREQRDG